MIYQFHKEKNLSEEPQSEGSPYSDTIFIADLPLSEQFALLQKEIRAHFVRNFPIMSISYRDDFWVYIGRLLYLLEACGLNFHTVYKSDFDERDVQEVLETELNLMYYRIKKMYEGMLQDFELYDEETRYYKIYMVQQTYILDLVNKQGNININYDIEKSERSLYKERITKFFNTHHWNNFLTIASRFVGKFSEELRAYLQNFEEEMKQSQEKAQMNQILARNDLATTLKNYKQLKKRQRRVAMEVNFALQSGKVSFVLASQKDKLQIARWASIDCFVLSLLGFLFTKVASYTQIAPIFSFLMLFFTGTFFLTEILIQLDRDKKNKE